MCVLQVEVEQGDDSSQHLIDDADEPEQGELVSRKCRVRPVHIFIGIACALTLCGFVLTVYGGVKIYYHDVFKVASEIGGCYGSLLLRTTGHDHTEQRDIR